MTKSKIRYCIDCGKKLNDKAFWNGTIRCKPCAMKKTASRGSNHYKWKGGKPHCRDCKAQLLYYTERCLDCSNKFNGIRLGKLAENNKGHKNPNWKGGKPKCQSCKKILSDYKSRLCRHCYIKNIIKDPNNNPNKGRKLTIKEKKHLSKINKGKKHTIETKLKLSNISKEKWQDEEFRNKTTLARIQATLIKPNKPETYLKKLLNKLFPKEYKYVGNGKVIINGFNPDFINVNGQKKIIELYGDYWHTLPKSNDIDKRRLEAYKTYGYKTLIIWEHELRNLNKLTDKLSEFC